MSEQEAGYGDYPPTEVQRVWTSGDGTEWFEVYCKDCKGYIRGRGLTYGLTRDEAMALCKVHLQELHPVPAQPPLPSPEAEQGMDEALSYRWAARAMRGVEGRIEPHHLASLADLISSAILQAYHLGEKERQDLVQLLREALELAGDAIESLEALESLTEVPLWIPMGEELKQKYLAIQSRGANFPPSDHGQGA